MKPIEDRLEASLRIGAFEGSDEEFYICMLQVKEAIKELRSLRKLYDGLIW